MKTPISTTDSPHSNDVPKRLIDRWKGGISRTFPNLTQFVIALFTACNFFLVLYLYTAPDPSVAKLMPTYVDGHVTPLKTLTSREGDKFEWRIGSDVLYFKIDNMVVSAPENQLVMIVTNRDNPTGHACIRAWYKWGPGSSETPFEERVDLTVGDSVGFLLAATSDHELHWMTDLIRAGRSYNIGGKCNYERVRRREGKIEFRPQPWTDVEGQWRELLRMERANEN